MSAPERTLESFAEDVVVNGTQLHCVRIGAGPPLLLMHGGLGLDHTTLRPFLDPLAEQLELFFYDHRGNGRSARGDLSAVTHATWAEDAEALRTRLGLDRILLFGHSYGGVLALEYALRHPERLAGLILCDTVPVFTPDMMAGLAEHVSPELLARLMSLMTSPPATDAALRDAWRSIAPMYFKRLDPALIDRMAATIQFSAAAFVQSMGHCLPSFDVRDRLGEIRVPTLLLTGADDWIMPPPLAAERLHAGIPQSRLVVIPEAGHYPFIEQPARFLSAVKGWLDELGQ